MVYRGQFSSVIGQERYGLAGVYLREGLAVTGLGHYPMNVAIVKACPFEDQ